MVVVPTVHEFCASQGTALPHPAHPLDGLEASASTFDPEGLVEERAVQALDDAVRLRPADRVFQCAMS